MLFNILRPYRGSSEIGIRQGKSLIVELYNNILLIANNVTKSS